LIAPKSETVIPVSCVEQGRWSYRSGEFASARRAMSADLKKKKSRSVRDNLRAAGSFASAQGMVWHEINSKFVRMAAAPSPTMALSDLCESHADMTADYLKAFHPVDNQIGMVVFIDGKVAGVELLGRFEAFEKNRFKLVHSYVMDALEMAGFKQKSVTKASKPRATKILEAAAVASVEKRGSVALGQDVRVESNDVVGSGLEFEGRVLQMSIFANEAEGSVGKSTSMSRASHRRNSIIR
jgi:predicted aconitase with swiveling domain